MIFCSTFLIFICIQLIIRKRETTIISTTLLMGILIAISGFRSHLSGPDTHVYFSDYNLFLNHVNHNNDFEFLFLEIEKLFANFGLSATEFIFFIAICSVGGVSFFYCRFSPMPLLSLLYYMSRYFLSRDLNQIRQAVACALVLWALILFAKKKYLWSYVIVISASGFHKVTLILIIILPIVSLINLNNKLLLVSAVMLAVMSYKIVGKIIYIIFDHYLHETTYTSYGDYVNGSGLLNPIIFLELFIFIGCLIYRYYLDTVNNMFELFLKIYFIGILLLISANQYAVISARIASLLTTTEPILFIYAIRGYKQYFFVSKCSFFKNYLEDIEILIEIAFTCAVFFLINISNNSISGYF